MAQFTPSTSASSAHPKWWLVVRVVWLLPVVSRLADFFPSLTTYISTAGRAYANGCILTSTQALQQTGISLSAYATLTTGLFVLCVL